MRFCQKNIDRAEKHEARDEWPYRNLNVYMSDVRIVEEMVMVSSIANTMQEEVQLGMGTNGQQQDMREGSLTEAEQKAL